MPSMSYCVIENTNEEMGVLTDVLTNLIENGEPITKYEQRALPHLMQSMRELVAMYDEAIANKVIDANGKIIDVEDETTPHHVSETITSKADGADDLIQMVKAILQ